MNSAGMREFQILKGSPGCTNSAESAHFITINNQDVSDSGGSQVSSSHAAAGGGASGSSVIHAPRLLFLCVRELSDQLVLSSCQRKHGESGSRSGVR